MRLGGKRFRAALANEVTRADGRGPDREPAIEAGLTHTYACADPLACLECRAADRVPPVRLEHIDPPARVECRATDGAEDIGVKASNRDPGQLLDSDHYNDGHCNGDHICHRDGDDPGCLDQPDCVREVT